MFATALRTQKMSLIPTESASSTVLPIFSAISHHHLKRQSLEWMVNCFLLKWAVQNVTFRNSQHRVLPRWKIRFGARPFGHTATFFCTTWACLLTESATAMQAKQKCERQHFGVSDDAIQCCTMDLQPADLSPLV